MENKIISRRRVLEAALHTVRFRIANLQPHYSREQIRCWYRERNMIIRELRALPTEQQVRENAKKNSNLVNQILNR